jgi:hypothetical protein
MKLLFEEDVPVSQMGSEVNPEIHYTTQQNSLIKIFSTV